MNKGVIHRMLMDATLYFIYYTSSDGNIIIPNSRLGRHVKSNAYIDGLGIMVCYNPMTSLEAMAFYNKTTLTGIIIPEGIISIDDYTFSGCTNLTSITIPSSVNYIGYLSFKNCNNLKVYISDLSAWCKMDVDDFDGSLPLYSTGSLYLNGSLVTDLVIPSDVTEIKPYTFDGYRKLKSITIPEGVISIGKHAFNLCINVNSITIPSSLISVGENALIVSSDLKIYISDLSSWCKIDSKHINPGRSGWGYLYLNGNLITDLVIPSDVTEIKSRAFLRLIRITSVTIPNSVTSIGERPFSECKYLNAFYGKFASSDNKCLVVDGLLILGVYTLSSYNIPENVTSIGSYAFYCNYKLTSVTMSDSVISINKYAFLLCYDLTSVILSENVTSISSYAFYECSKLASIVIPENVTSIGESAFGHCGLENIYCKRSIPPTGGSYMFPTNGSIEIKIYVPIDSVSLYKEAEYWSDYADYIVGYDFESNNV